MDQLQFNNSVSEIIQDVYNLRAYLYSEACFIGTDANDVLHHSNEVHHHTHYFNNYCIVNNHNKINPEIFQEESVKVIFIPLSLNILPVTSRYEKWKNETKQSIINIKESTGNSLFMYQRFVKALDYTTVSTKYNPNHSIYSLGHTNENIGYVEPNVSYLNSIYLRYLLCLLGFTPFYHHNYYPHFLGFLSFSDYILHDEISIVKEVTEIDCMKRMIVETFLEGECCRLHIKSLPKVIVDLCIDFMNRSVVQNKVCMEIDSLYTKSNN